MRKALLALLILALRSTACLADGAVFEVTTVPGDFPILGWSQNQPSINQAREEAQRACDRALAEKRAEGWNAGPCVFVQAFKDQCISYARPKTPGYLSLSHFGVGATEKLASDQAQSLCATKTNDICVAQFMSCDGNPQPTAPPAASTTSQYATVAAIVGGAILFLGIGVFYFRASIQAYFVTKQRPAAPNVPDQTKPEQIEASATNNTKPEQIEASATNHEFAAPTLKQETAEVQNEASQSARDDFAKTAQEPAADQEQPLSFKAWFLEAVRAGGERRKLAFRYLIEKHASKFNGVDGIRLYEQLRPIVVDAADPIALAEFEQSFAALVDQNLLKNRTEVSDAEQVAAPAKERHFATPSAMPPSALRTVESESVKSFVNMARKIYRIKGPDRFVEWISIAFDALSDAEQKVLLGSLLRIVLDAEDDAPK